MLIIPAVVESVKTKRDKTLAVTFGTNELSSEQSGELLSANQNYVFLAIKSEQFNNAEQEAIQNLQIDESEVKTKTPSQRLRATMYRVWLNDNKGYNDFRNYYEKEMDRLNDNYKKLLE